MSRSYIERQYLTQKYQEKQSRLHKQYWGPFKDYGKFTNEDLVYYKLLDVDPFENGCYLAEAPTKETLGRWRKHSWKDCGVARCPMCDNPRRLKTHGKKQQLTLAEHRNNDSFKAQMEDYYRDGLC